MAFHPSYLIPEGAEDSAHWFLFNGDRLLVQDCGTGRSVPLLTGAQTEELGAENRQYLGCLNGVHCFAGHLATEDTLEPARGRMHPLRRLLGALPEEVFHIACRARHLTHWDSTSRFCGRCGGTTGFADTERAKICSGCGQVAYPRISPAVIVAVVNGSRILLASSSLRYGRMYSVLAGFVEPGEALEACVVREIREEVGITVTDIRYFASQPWPFPDSLMIGFTAQYAGGEITPDGTEITDAGWFGADELPEIPGPYSISRSLIDWFVEQHQ